MQDIRELICWPDLQKAGFIKINYYSMGKLQYVGAALQDDHGSDIIEIKPFTFSSRTSVWDIRSNWKLHLHHNHSFSYYSIPSHLISQAVRILLLAKENTENFSTDLYNQVIEFEQSMIELFNPQALIAEDPQEDYDSMRNEIRRLHTVCRGYREEISRIIEIPINLISHLPGENWGDHIVDGKITLEINSDLLDNAISLVDEFSEPVASYGNIASRIKAHYESDDFKSEYYQILLEDLSNNETEVLKGLQFQIEHGWSFSEYWNLPHTYLSF